MQSTNELIDKVKEQCSFPSDNALAQRLGVTRALVSGWRNGRYAIPDERIAQLCAIARLDGASWMARIHTERAASATERALWQSILDRLTPITAVVGAMVLAIGMMPATGQKKTIEINSLHASSAHSLYIMS
uniref:DUF3693 domain-containing protein n=1 Tax=Xanthomonas sp. MWU16-30325 TaxID=2878096 RepID=UPI001CF85917